MTSATSIEDALATKHEVMTRGYANGDAEIIANQFYTPDALVVGPDNAFWDGHENVLSLYKSVVGVYKWTFERQYLVQLSEDSASEFVIGVITPVEAGETLSYKIQFIWKRTAAGWHCISQFFAPGKSFG
ncbi:hypothetical protein D3C81_952650 [compost metagenome]